MFLRYLKLISIALLTIASINNSAAARTLKVESSYAHRLTVRAIINPSPSKSIKLSDVEVDIDKQKGPTTKEYTLRPGTYKIEVITDTNSITTSEIGTRGNPTIIITVDGLSMHTFTELDFTN